LQLKYIPNLSFNSKLQLVCAVLLLLEAYSVCPSNRVVMQPACIRQSDRGATLKNAQKYAMLFNSL